MIEEGEWLLRFCEEGISACSSRVAEETAKFPLWPLRQLHMRHEVRKLYSEFEAGCPLPGKSPAFVFFDS